jgi:hypothetical protein
METLRESATTDDLDPAACARWALEALRAGEDPSPSLDRLADASNDALRSLREDRATALAFWTNLYNVGTQLLLDRRPDLYDSRLRMVRFFRAPAVTVAGTDCSLDTIEHGILRGSRSKYGLGYLPRVFVSSFERRYRLDDPNPRVHFALNCGAASCPAIRAYAADDIDEQLDMATGAYLDTAVTYDAVTDTAALPQLFRWYRGDFDGPSGIRGLLREYEVIPDGASPSLSYRSWDWRRAAEKFAEGSTGDSTRRGH